MSTTTTYGDALPPARELWEKLASILACDLVQSVTGKDETTEALEATQDWLEREWPKLAIYPLDMVNECIYHDRDEPGWPYSEGMTNEILDALNGTASDLAIVLDCVGDIFPCALCGGYAASQPGPNLVERTTKRFVCRTCGKQHAPELLALVEFDCYAYGVGQEWTLCHSWESIALDYWRKVYGPEAA